MVRYKGRVQDLFWVLFLPVMAGFGIPGNDNDEIRLSGALELNDLASAATTDGEEGMPERGQFLFIYSYQGQTIEPEISITRNGETAASLSRLSAVSSDTLVNLQADKGDELVFDIQFDNDRATVFLHNSFASFEQGFWANQFSVNFFLLDEDGNPVEFLGTMSMVFYLFPPFNGFEFTGNPTSIAPGGHSTLNLQAIEAPNEPVIVPEATMVALQTSPTGIRLGGYSLPDFGLHRVQGITATYGLLTGTRLWYEADPDSTLLEGTSETVSLLAFSPYDVNINGGTAVEVSVDEEEDISIEFVSPIDSDVWPTLPGFSFSGRNINENNIVNGLIEVTKGDEPLSGKSIEISVEFQAESGGHHHNNAPPDSLMGEIVFEFGSTTDQEGEVLFDYVTPTFSGIFFLKAQVDVNNVTYEESFLLEVKVPDLEPLEDSPFYEKIGAPDNNVNTNDPCREPETLTSVHFDNHYGVPELLTAINNIAREYYNFDNQTKLRVNDISLKWGGIFDIFNNWRNPHWEHRIGKQADIGIMGINQDGSCNLELNSNFIIARINRHTDEKTYIHFEDEEETIIDHFHIRVR
jgi:hypothetical protein